MSGAFLFLICILTEFNQLLTGHYNAINQHQIIFWTRMLLLSVSFNLNCFSTYQYHNKRTLMEQIVPIGLVSLSLKSKWIKKYINEKKDSLSWIMQQKKDVTVLHGQLCILLVYILLRDIFLCNSSVSTLVKNKVKQSSNISFTYSTCMLNKPLIKHLYWRVVVNIVDLFVFLEVFCL